MNKVEYLREPMAVGATTTVIRTALGCCLLKLGPGIYSVIKRCTRTTHQGFAPLAVDSAWVNYHEQKRYLEPSQRAKYSDHLDRLRILHYESYRPDDVVWAVSSARAHRLRTFELKMPRLEILNARSSPTTSVVRRRVRSIPAKDCTFVDGVNATTPTRTSCENSARARALLPSNMLFVEFCSATTRMRSSGMATPTTSSSSLLAPSTRASVQ